MASSEEGKQDIQLSEVIPLMEEVHRMNGRFVPNIGIPSAFKQKDEVWLERMMGRCDFKTFMACVLGKGILKFMKTIYKEEFMY